MIVLNQNKEFVQVETWEDIQERPGFTDNLDPAKHDLSGIIGQYAFADKIRCGLSNCHTPHAKGYLVVTKSGVETNIGQVCGKKYFGVEFETMAQQFDRDLRDQQARERLWSFFHQIEAKKKIIDDLRKKEHGADWVHKTSRPLVEAGNGFPSVITRKINSMLKTGNFSLNIEREATAREYEISESNGGRTQRPLIMEEKIADIHGLDVLRNENSLREILVIDINENLKSLERLNIDNMLSKDLSKWSKWVGEFDQKLEKATFIAKTGLTLLTRNNLAPFIKILEDPDDVNKFQAYLNRLN